MTPLALLIALAVIGMAANMAATNPSVVRKTKLLDTYAAEAVEAGVFTGSSIELPRGAENVKFSLDGTLFDRGTANETYTFKIQGRNSSSEGWQDIAGAAFTTVSATTASEQVPTAANAPGVVIPRFVRVHLTTVGTSPIATCKIYALYDDTGRQGGRQYQANYQGG